MSWSILTPIIIVAGALVIITLERLFPYDKGQKFLREGFVVDFVWYALIQSFVCTLIISALVRWVDGKTGASTYGLVSDWPIWLQVAFFVVTHDFYIYWFHRSQHHNRFLWRLHEAHHAAKYVDWIAGSRSHTLEILINQSIEFGAMILLGADPDVILIKGAISACWGMWIHCNVNVHSGLLQYVINGPELHRWHHAIDYPQHVDGGVGSNYGTKFAFWDYLFGTAYRPAKKPAGYGLSDPFPKGYFAQHAYAFRRFDAPSNPTDPAAPDPTVAATG
ncbi:MAG: sterol desaturase family protein [Deltaproteobacteria bacterium]|nr:sterol desaturase family protein [Deltaproteobacteria bacterium]MCW5806406.1 sterol desaturase family protein [Deltaproteobacteria bacterium]